ncbi:serine hydrolase [uncultured Tyzzerella sp.]|uniref:serine hydrolase domain-containing protein n=1 Tax=uncultured Tyzzerella sp. TaxID=2321398 RepID=UPI00294200DE|nr:serine hydrolase [uncultured Tyzzerella sp.]
MKNFKVIIVLVVVAIVLVSIIKYKDKVKLIYTSLNSFKDENLPYTFQNTAKIQPVRIINKGENTFEFNESNSINLPKSFSFKNSVYSVDDFIEETRTTGLLIIKDDNIKYEKYYLGGDKDTLFSSNSMGKSFVSALMGIAVSEGYINSVDEPIGKYIPQFKNTDLENIPIKACLQMASGIKFDEEKDLSKFSIKTLLGVSPMKLIAKSGVEEKPFTHRKYLSINTEILGEIITNATGYSLSQYMEEKLWKKIGVQSDAYWTLNNNKELAMGGLNISLRDYARFGRLYLNDGVYNKEQIIPKEWIEQSLDNSSPYSRPDKTNSIENAIGYGYQWWIPESNEKEFLAIGVYGQFLYVNPLKNIIIVKTSADSNFNKSDYEIKNIEFFRSIVDSIS